MQGRVQLCVSCHEEQFAGSLSGPETCSTFPLCLQVSQDAEDLHTSRLQIVAMSGTMQNVDELRQWLGAEVYVTDCRSAPGRTVCRGCSSADSVAAGRGTRHRLQARGPAVSLMALSGPTHTLQAADLLPQCSYAGLLHAQESAKQLTGRLRGEAEMTCASRQLQYTACHMG